MGNDRHTYCSFSQALRSGALALSLLGLGFHPLFAQEQLLPVLHFETLEGFRPEWVTAQVVRDSFGYVWIGTLNGLRRYDGYDYKEYRNIPDDPSSLSSSRIHSLLVDRKQRLWVGTTEKGLSLYDRSHDRFINFYPYPDDSSSGSRVVHRMTEDHSGNIWLATLGGVISVCLPENSDSYGEDSLARKLCFRRIPLQTPRGEGRDIVERSDGKIIVGSDSGLFILDPSTLTLARPRFNNADSLKKVIFQLELRNIMEYEAGQRNVEQQLEYQRRMRDFREGLMADRFVRTVLGQNIDADEDEIREYYNLHLEEFITPRELHLQEIEVDSSQQAVRIAEQLSAGADFGALAAKYTVRSGFKETKGDLGLVQPGRFPALYEASRNLVKGQVSDTIQNDDGKYSIVKLLDTKESAAVPVESAVGQIKQKVIALKRSSATADWLKEQRSKTEITVYDDVLRQSIDKAKYEKS